MPVAAVYRNKVQNYKRDNPMDFQFDPYKYNMFVLILAILSN